MLTLSTKMPLGEALSVSLIGIGTVMIILAVIACLILLVSKAIRTIEALAAKKSPADEVLPFSSAQAIPEGMNSGEVELINTDEKTAAVIMAIVSEKSGIPLSRLSFRSIKLIEEEKEGETKHD